jgi:hypothetical protein
MSSLRWCSYLSFFVAVLLLAITGASAQQASPEKPRVQTPAARLAEARNILIIRSRGSAIPYDVIKETVAGWGRFTLVETPEQADILIQISTSGGDSEVRVTSSNDQSTESGKPNQSYKTSKDISATDVTLTVLDARNRRVLWEARETARFAMKQTARENNLVEAAQRLASKFHERLEGKK